MKKLLSLLAVLALVLSCCIMGIGTVASAAEESPEADFIVFDGVLEEYIGPGGDVVLPASLGVTEIAADAIRVNNDITSFVIPEGVEVIGLRAFYMCENLSAVTLPYSIYELGQEAFNGCALTEVMIPPQVEYVPYGCFQGNKFLSEIKLSYGVKEIHGGAFGGTIDNEIVFPETIELIGGVAFNYVNVKENVKWYICNPDCEIGIYAKGVGKSWQNHEFEAEPFRPINNSVYQDMRVEMHVPKDSAVGKFIEEKHDVMLNKATDQGACNNRYLVKYHDQEYFDKLEENQEGYGTQPPADDNTPAPGTPSTPGTPDPNGNGNGNGNGNNGNGAANNGNNNNGSSGGQQIVVEGSDDGKLWLILGIAGGVFLLVIIGVVVFLVIYMKKPKAAPAPYGYPPYGYPQYPGYPPVGPDGQPIPPQAPEAPVEETTEEAPAEDAE